MKIREAEIADKKQVLSLAEKFATSFDIIEAKFNEVFNNMVEDENVSFIVAEIENKVVGYCLAFHHQTFYANGLVSWVEEITVDEKLRGKNIGSRMMKKIEEISREKDSKVIALATRRSENFYRKNDYEESAICFRKLL
jgi:N-acetylglutamate synthase-like GNAT family acetyltransferase